MPTRLLLALAPLVAGLFASTAMLILCLATGDDVLARAAEGAVWFLVAATGLVLGMLVLVVALLQLPLPAPPEQHHSP